jgi:imidazole glycerol phosphate synthase glutamine amidotransferase subunit
VTHIAVLDYGAGNLRSAQRALERAGADVTVTPDATTAAAADALVVPGVGHFGQCVGQFVAAGLRELVTGWVDAGRPLLGICVGMQILYPSSEESPGVAGLGLLPGTVKLLPKTVTVPHMGWNTVIEALPDPVLDGIAGQHVYFVHSYAAVPSDPEHVLATSDYGPGFPAVVRVGSVVGTQFHPEKSADVGARFLRNWVREVEHAVVAA